MTIALWIYGISWSVLFGVFVISLFQARNGKELFNGEAPWYLYVIIILFCPLVVPLIPYISFENLREKKQQKRREEWRLALEKEKEDKKSEALMSYEASQRIDLSSELVSFDKTSQYVQSLIGEKQFDQIFLELDMITPEKGYQFGIDVANWDNHISKPYVRSGNGEKDYEIFNHLIVKDTPEGAWQACFLYKLWHSLPLYDHSNYGRRIYIEFDKSSYKFSPIRNDDKENIQKIICDNHPKTIITRNQNKYYINRYYWNDWSGLVRELVEVTIENNRATIFDIESTVVVSYDCGILF